MNLKSDFLALLGLCAFAISQPILGTLGHGSTFFVVHRADALDIITLALVIFFLPAILLISLAGCLQIISRPAAILFISIAAGALVALWSMSLASALPPTVAIAIALVVGAVLGSCYYLFSRVRELVKIIGLLSPLVVVFFLAFMPVSSLIFPERNFGGAPAATNQTPIVMLLFDELSLAAITTPDGEIDAGRLPNFSRLERISTWYRNTTTVSTQTDKAVPAMLSGMRPDENTQPLYGQFPRNLFTLFAGSHTINAVETFTRLCPEKICTRNGVATLVEFDAASIYRDIGIVWLYCILPEELTAKYLPPISSQWGNFGQDSDSASSESKANLKGDMLMDLAMNPISRFNKFKLSLQKSTGPSVNYLHLALPHVPWRYLPDGTAYNGKFSPGRTTNPYGWQGDQYLVDEGLLRYSLQVEYVDLLLGQVLDALEKSGRLNELMLIVVSDHGVAFSPGKPSRKPTAITLADVSRVPLFIKYPGQRLGKRDDSPIETIDILPTVADILGLPLGDTVDGQSIISDSWRPAVRHVLEAGSDFPHFEHDMDARAASERFYRVLKPGRSALDTIGLGAGHQFIGKPPPVPTRLEPRYTLQLFNSKWYMEVDSASGYLPARMAGSLNGAKVGTQIMVALNGTVAGSGMTYDDSGSFSIMLDPRRFQNGKNEIQAYVLGAGEILEVKTASDFEDWSLHANDTGIASVTDNQGLSYQLDESLKGRARFNVLGTAISGYACDEENRLAPKTMLLVEDNKIIIISSNFIMKNIPLPENGMRTSELQCQFSLDVNMELSPGRSALRILALFEGGRMMEIHPGK